MACRARVVMALVVAMAACVLPAAIQAAPGPLAAPSARPILGAHYPALSPDGKALCFSYRGDLWTVPSTGGVATRLTVHRAYDAWPRWSPDGNWIAFSSARNGNNDIFLIPARGGEARQLTYHSADEIVTDWSPDGSRVLFASNRDGRFGDLYTISVKDGRLRRLTRDGTSSRYGMFLPDGRSVVYARGGQLWWRPRYTGGQRNAVYRLRLADGKAEPVARYDGMASWPLPAPDGKTVYFVREKDDAANLWRAPIAGGDAVQITHHNGSMLRYPTIARDGSRIAYEQGFRIWVLPIGSGGIPGEPKPIDIIAPSDTARNEVERQTLANGVSAADLSADGTMLAIGLRGDIWTVKSDGGDAKRMTKSTSLEDNPSWSSDGAMIAYETDRHSGLDIYVLDAKTLVERRLTDDPADDADPVFAPDGTRVAFVRSGGPAPGLYVVDASPSADPGGRVPESVLVAAGAEIGDHEWSPDGRWLAYAREDATGATDIWIVRSVGGTPINATRYPATNRNPQWTRDGKRLVFASTRGSDGPGATANLYSIELKPEPPKDDDSSTPVAPGRPSASDAEEPEAQRRRPPGAPPAGGPGGGGPPPGAASPRASLVQIEFEGIENRAKPVTSLRERIGRAAISPDSRTAAFVMDAVGRTGWWQADLTSGAVTPMSAAGESGDYARFAPDGASFVFIGGNRALFRLSRGAPAATPIALRAAAEIDYRAEMAEAFNQAWRTLRAQFYDPQMHGTDWAALRKRYEPLLQDTVVSEDLAWLLSSMIGELNASHLGATAAPQPGPRVETGYLGLTFDQDHTGPGLRVSEVLPHGPADQPGRRISVGSYLMAIDGTDVTWGEDVFKLLRDRAGQNVEILVAPQPAKDAARTIKVKPVTRSAIDDLVYDRWVEARRRQVDALSGGRVAYVHIRSMDRPSLQRFQRALFGDAQSKQALVIDVRNNGGGRIHDELLALLVRRPHGYEVPRRGERSSQPFQVWNRPTVVLTNEFSSSDAEVFPNGFREYRLGKIVGTQTAGAVIGTFDITLIDGTRFRVPTSGWYTVAGQNLENRGVAPDVPVEMTPADYASDNDRQLEAAVRTVMEDLKGK